MMSSININNFPSLKTMHPFKVKVLTEFVDNAQGKTFAQALPALLTAKQQLQSKGMSFSKEESQLMIEAMAGHLSEEDKQKLTMMRNMMENIN